MRMGKDNFIVLFYLLSASQALNGKRGAELQKYAAEGGAT